MPERKINHRFHSFVSAVIVILVGCAMHTNCFAQPVWCPDLTQDYFVNFPDFAVQADDWLQTGPGLAGDFITNGTVDLNDVSYLALWWLHDCNNPPPDFCPGCIYPDCNLTDCNAPMTYPCSNCESTPRFIIVSINGSRGCGCACSQNLQYSVYVDPNHSIDGNYIVPYTDEFGRCAWSGIYNHSIIIERPYYNGGCCVYPADPDDIADRCDKVKITITRMTGSEPTVYVDIYLWNIYWQEWWWEMDLSDVITNVTNCIEGTGITAECGDYGPDPQPGTMPPLWGDNGTITITIP